MAVELEFINFIVLISLIEQKYVGGWRQCRRDHRRAIGRRIWYDEYLFRDGAMGQWDIKSLVDEWTAKGFEPFDESSGIKKWKDMAVVDKFAGLTLPCDWLEISKIDNSLYLKGTIPGKICTRETVLDVPEPIVKVKRIEKNPNMELPFGED